MFRLSEVMIRAATAPFAELDEIIGTGGLVVLAPHPDDESLGCGGLLCAAAQAGRNVAVMVVTDGRLSHPSSPSVDADALAQIRTAELRDAVKTLHPDIRLHDLGFHDCGVSDTPPGSDAAVEAILAAIDAIGATALFTTWRGDPHQDHVATAALARQAAAERPDVRLWSYPIWGRFTETEIPLPAMILQFDTAPHQVTKTAAIACHRSQMTRLIADDPQGFMMSPAMQMHFIDHPEVFLADA
ncbi:MULTISPECIES: PIG-L family deacetylase [unclassified Yoonia]|uniref:PIG-L deacetylase family protein n=1 Tax=unclassified Yoonia TaxID=2629118 RepID=UPI002AFF265C|nr:MULTISPECIES: PIG-L family deacetylase [unclassified Yoonia]